MHKIIEVDKGDFRAFVYAGDVTAQSRPGSKTLPDEPLSPAEFVKRWQPSPHGPLLLLAAWYAAEMPTAFLDIGSNIGTDSIRVAKLSRLIGRRFPIIAFEPGVNAALVPRTLKLNGLDDLVTFEEMCVSNSDKPTLLFGEDGTSVNNRIVNRRPDKEGFSKLVRSTTLDAYLDSPELRDRHPIAKIDTQGAEWLIWQGMKETATSRQMSFIMEFVPWALQRVVRPAKFLDELASSFLLFNLRYDRREFVPIEHFRDFLASAQQPPHWTDILCISRRLPSAPQLIERIRAGYKAGQH
jgi:FkbM family methyltransferase